MLLIPVLLSLITSSTLVNANKIVNLQTYKKPVSSLSKRALGPHAGLTNSADTAYFVDLLVGSNNDKVTVQLDTGSADMFVYPSGLSDCSMCSTYGTFDYSTSTTFSELNGAGLKVSYGDGSSADGEMGTDNVIMNGVQIPDVTFGVTSGASSANPMLGVGFKSLVGVTDSSGYRYDYNPFPYAMANKSVINIPSYAISLFDEDTSNVANSSIIFGGIDTTRYSGGLYRFPVAKEEGADEITRVGIVLNGISIQEGSYSNPVKWISSGEQFVQLDTGTGSANIPVDTYEYIGQNYFGNKGDDGKYSGDCNTISNYTLYFNFLGLAYPVPLSNFATQETSDSSKCYFDVVPSYSGTMCIFGDMFLKSIYLVVDLQNAEVGLGSSLGIDYAATQSPNFVEIVDSIPQSENAPNYSSGMTYSSNSTLDLVAS